MLLSVGTRLFKLHLLHSSSPVATAAPSSLRIVCISGTHNSQPDLPPGDILIHAGDLTENRSLDEVQAQLDWLSSQPHLHKVVIAGNHDVLLDENFLEKHPERRYGATRTVHELDWGPVHYLLDSSIALEFGRSEFNPDDRAKDYIKSGDKRTLVIYGSPRTPQDGVSTRSSTRG
ncbi:hypothetical protein PRK78_001587 [Emydomyces testavorans]|uniref:Calcineurin-like phosphoesterase domain-containing protein n=1 Tax=Emydomyces testavorans TaxID=2070801 RepID=A0AAF0DES1_9EURO|nr:hypothetical protein PRK78_001587 [Emydomyces testavorans]